MHVGLLQLNATIGDFPGNLLRLREAYETACQQGAEIVVAPELFLCGYPPRDLLLREDFVLRNESALLEAAAWVGKVPLFVGYVDRNPERPGKPLRNAAAMLVDGQVAHRQAKMLLPTYDVFDEARYFEPGSNISPIVWNGHRIGLTICEDIWNDEDFWPERIYRRDPVRELASQGIDIILNLSASPWHEGKESTRLAMLRRVAQDERVPLVQVNTVGANDELIFDGQSLCFNASGGLVFQGRSFAEEVVVIDVTADTAIPLVSQSREALLYDGLVLGIRDYVRKCGFKGVVLGLSGGIDSALTAVLAVEALGKENVLGVAMPSRYSSEGSWKDAEALAKNLGVRFEVIAIEPGFKVMEEQLQPLFAGRARNEAEENIQSRLRGLTLMAISNKFGCLVLTTGNKSEMAVGYCTLYGDMCGALAPIADVFKMQIFSLCRWINRSREIIPWPSITKSPSAELRPNQTDQDSLPPYEFLDAILEGHVVQNKSRADLIALGHPADMVNDVLNKVTFSEYKRRQAAPGLKVSPRAFGMGRRIPIAQKFRT